MRRPLRILILAGDTNGNLGDRGLVLATCDTLRLHAPDLRISLASANLDVDRECFRAEVFPRGVQGLGALIAHAKAADVVIVGGGGLFQDDDSLIKMPYWALRVGLARLLCRRVIGFSLGVGPLQSFPGRVTARLAFRLMERVTVRDPEAQRTAQALSSVQVDVVPDPALLLDAAPESEVEAVLLAKGVPLGAGPLIGVAARRWFYVRGGLIPHKYRVRMGLSPASGLAENAGFIDAFVAALDAAISRHGAHIVLMPSYASAHEGDREICTEIQRRLPSGSATLLTVEDPRLYKGIAGRLDVLIGGRMHPTIFAASAGTPVIGLSYNQKFDGFFALLGQPDHVMSIERFAEEQRTDQLGELIDRVLDEGSAPLSTVHALQETTGAFLGELCGAEESSP